jgi:FlaA1/EpsC-like NDP-sugar epimerase
MTHLRPWLIGLPRLTKRIVLVLNDIALISAALWLLLSLRYNVLFWPRGWEQALVIAAAPLIGVAVFAWGGLYRIVTRYIGHRGTYRIFGCMTVAVLMWALLILMTGVEGIPRTVVLLYGVLAGSLVLASRHVAAWALKSAGVRIPGLPDEAQRTVLIYGAGAVGVQLLEALRRRGEARVAGFLDDTPSLKGQYIGGLKVYRSDKLAKLIEREGVKEVLLALPESSRRDRREVLKRIEGHPIRIKTLPAIEDIAVGRVSVSDLRAVDVGDLLGRDPVPPRAELLGRAIRGKAVMVTGAGGSIGSELVRQIVRQGPRRLVLFEVSEVALYEIEMEVKAVVAEMAESQPRPEIVTALGSVLDPQAVRTAIAANEVATIYHAAAYKHVPIVELNPVAGLANNTFGTAVIAAAARAHGVERFVLISTDKAVRPTNVMGASKRLAELVLQAEAKDARGTVFTMVRFGNVLDSSGSVVKLFRKQIEAGGPVTVTHPDVIRYFMSIPEAAELVLQAGAMATGGEVFVLDMGEQVKIDELARSMIRLMGLEVRDEANPDGDIAIAYVGLRPGEKLYEELLLGENATGTEHPRILRIDEPALAPADLKRELQTLRQAMDGNDAAAINAVLMRTVEGYRPDGHGGGRSEPASSAWPASRTLH